MSLFSSFVTNANTFLQSEKRKEFRERKRIRYASQMQESVWNLQQYLLCQQCSQLSWCSWETTSEDACTLSAASWRCDWLDFLRSTLSLAFCTSASWNAIKGGLIKSCLFSSGKLPTQRQFIDSSFTELHGSKNCAAKKVTITFVQGWQSVTLLECSKNNNFRGFCWI